MNNSHEQLRRLHQIGIALSYERDLAKLLDLILREARGFTQADAGSLYIREQDQLVSILAQNDSLQKRKHKKFTGSKVSVSKESIAGYVAATKTLLNIPDAYAIEAGSPYRFNQDSDVKQDYRTQSILAVPLQTQGGDVIGVLELINALDDTGQVKPFDANLEVLVHSLASQAAVSIINARLLSDLKSAHLNTILRLSVAAEYRDDDTASHLRRISIVSVILAKQLRLPEEDIEILSYASPMHDIGKIGVPDAILLKPGKLTPEEFEIVKRHTMIGAKILEGSELKLFLMAKEIALTHHEKFDGGGYPQGLKGEAIPLTGRIVAVPDVFDALISKRNYKPAFPLEKSLEIIKGESGKHFDPEVTRAFFDCIDKIIPIYKKEKML